MAQELPFERAVVINLPGMKTGDGDVSLFLQFGWTQKKHSNAAAERRSIAQVCEAFLKIGSANYKNEGNKLLQRSLARAWTNARVE